MDNQLGDSLYQNSRRFELNFHLTLIELGWEKEEKSQILPEVWLKPSLRRDTRIIKKRNIFILISLF